MSVDRETEHGPEMSSRLCRWCRTYFVVPVGAPTPPGCPRCAPTIEQAIGEVEAEAAADAAGVGADGRAVPADERPGGARGGALGGVGAGESPEAEAADFVVDDRGRDDRPEPDPALALCDYCRHEPAFAREIVSERTSWWICVECIEAVIDRENAIALDPGIVAVLEPLPSPLGRVPAWRAPAPKGAELWSPQLDELRRQWLASDEHD